MAVLCLLVFLCVGGGLLGGIVTFSEIPIWYAGLNKPPGTPPNSWFGPVWTTLYVMMAVSAWLVWKHKGFKAEKTAFILFGIQFVLNFLWSFIFFGAHQIGLALIDILLLEAMIIATIFSFLRSTPTAALLLVPYALWVIYATYLNAAIWYLNP